MKKLIIYLSIIGIVFAKVEVFRKDNQTIIRDSESNKVVVTLSSYNGNKTNDILKGGL